MVNVIHTISDNQSAYHMTFPTFRNLVKHERSLEIKRGLRFNLKKRFILLRCRSRDDRYMVLSKTPEGLSGGSHL